MIRRRYRYIAIMMLLATACTDGFQGIEHPENHGDVVVSASVEGAPVSRAPEETNDGIIPVKSGDYTWSMDTEHSCLCRFVNGVGRIYPNGSSTPLQWSIFEYEGPYDFWLDNVVETTNVVYPDEKGKTYFIGPVWSNEEKKRYRAAQDTGDGEHLAPCDIVWGTASASKNATIEFELRHRMSRTTVVLTNMEEGDKEKKFTVKLTNLILEPAAFNRINGEVFLKSPAPDAASPQYEELTLLEDGLLTITDEDDTTIGRTPAFILPPQSAHDENRKCYLKVTVDGTTYSAPLPDLMIHTPENVSDNTGFTRGCHVEIRAHIATDEENPRIEFGPVYVKEWDDVGDKVVPALPGGITSVDDLKELIKLYNQMPDLSSYTSLDNGTDTWLLGNSDYKNIFRRLTRYGRHTYLQSGYTGKMYWDFKLRNDITFSSSDLEKFRYNYFSSCYPFNIDFGARKDFDGYKMIIDGTEYTSFEEVKGLLIDIPSGEEEFQKIVELYNGLKDPRVEVGPDLTKFDENMAIGWYMGQQEFRDLVGLGAQYEWRQSEGKLYWTFQLKQNTTLPAGFTKFDNRELYPFTFEFNSYTLNIDGSDYTSFTDEVKHLLIKE